MRLRSSLTKRGILVFLTLASVLIFISRFYEKAAAQDASYNARLSARPITSQNPLSHLRIFREIPTRFTGTERHINELASSLTRPITLASADFDEDGVPDLVCGYISSAGGFLTLHRGNVDAIYPNTAEARDRKAQSTFTTIPFLPDARVFELLDVPELLFTADLDMDGHADIIASRLGGSRLYLLRGNGSGLLGPPRAIDLPGRVTSLAIGEINRHDGAADIAVGVVGSNGSRLLVFDSAKGGLGAAPVELALPGPAEFLVLADFNGDYVGDIGIQVQQRLLILDGRRESSILSSRLPVAPFSEVLQLPSKIAAFSIGNFAPDVARGVNLLLEDSGIYGVRGVRESAATGHEYIHPFSLRRQALQGPSSNLIGESGTLDRRTQMSQVSQSGSIELRPLIRPSETRRSLLSNNPVFLLRARLPDLSGEAPVILDGSNRKLLFPERTALARNSAASTTHSLNLPVEGKVISALPMRLNEDGLTDFVLLTNGPDSLVALVSASVNSFVVNSSGSNPDDNEGDGICCTQTDFETGQCNGVCTLRAAAAEAAASAGADTISFSVLSVFDESASLNSTVTVIGGGVELPNLGGNGFSVGGPNCVVRGLVINRGSNTGMTVESTGAFIEGNLIGTDRTGTVALGNAGEGIAIESFASNNTIGGTTAAARNLVSSNGGHGLQISGDGNTIQGNYVGTDFNGTSILGNGGVGALVSGAGNILGGASANLFSGNSAGIALGILSGSGHIIQGNLIGTDASGSSPLPNVSVLFGHGIMTQSSGDVLIEGNTIAYNGGAGVQVSAGGTLLPNPILSNSIFSNGGLGIAFGFLGVTPNDPGDADTGPNALQNFPDLTSVTTNAVETIVEGALDSTPNTTFRIEFFSNSVCDSSGHGEGEIFLGSRDVTTNSNGLVAFGVTLPVSVSAGQLVTATATDPSGNTSEFSACVECSACVEFCFLLTRTHTGLGGDPTANPASSSGCSTGRYHSGEQIQLTASPSTGWQVGSWTGTSNDPSSSLTNSLVMPSGPHATAVHYVEISVIPNDLVLSNDTISQPNLYQACNSITLGPALFITAGAPGVTLRAPTILMVPESGVLSGAVVTFDNSVPAGCP